MAKVIPDILQRARELRQPLTLAEEKLWYRLRDSQVEGLKIYIYTSVICSSRHKFDPLPNPLPGRERGFLSPPGRG